MATVNPGYARFHKNGRMISKNGGGIDWRPKLDKVLKKSKKKQLTFQEIFNRVGVGSGTIKSYVVARPERYSVQGNKVRLVT